MYAGIRFPRFLLTTPLLLALLAGCADDDDSIVTTPVNPAEVRTLAVDLGLDGNPVDGHVIPAANDPKFILGRAIFFSSKMSGSGDISCASCHMPQLGTADGLSLAVGVDAVFPDIAGPGRVQSLVNSLDPRTDGGPNMSRNVTALFNMGLFNRAQFWDGRVYTMDASVAPNAAGQTIATPDSPFAVGDPHAGESMLQALVLFPVTTLVEMRGFSAYPGVDRHDYRAKIAQNFGHYGDFASVDPTPWLPLFQAAFGPGTAQDLITYANIARAVEAYIQHHTYVDTPWANFLAGNDSALSPAAMRGARLFFTPASEGGANCAACHSGDLFSDEDFHILAIPQIGRGNESQQEDYGRYTVTRVEADRYAFRTPTLLNVAVTAPYGHSGSYPTLEKIIRHHLDPAAAIDAYDFTNLSDVPQLQGLGATYQYAEENTRRALAALQTRADPDLVQPISLGAGQIADLVAFLREGLTDPCVRDAACTAHLIPDTSDPAQAPDSSVMALRFSNFAEGLATRPPAPVVSHVGPDGAVPIGPVVASCTPTRTTPAATVTWSFSEESLAVGFSAPQPLVLPFPLNNDLQFVELESFTGGTAPVDINGDCLLDIFVLQPFAGPTRLYVANGSGGYDERAMDYGLDLTGGYSTAMFADLDGDGDDDLLLGKAQDGPPELWIREGGTFVQTPNAFQAQRNSFSFGVGDIDNDRDLDVFVAYWDFDQLSPDTHLWLNNGDATFEPGDLYYGIADDFQPFDASFSPGFMDYDGDGLLDMLLTADQRQSKVFHNVDGESLANATDTSVITENNGMGVAIADFDRDGDPDWFLTSVDATAGSLPWTTNGNRLYRNEGDGTFVDATDIAGVRHGAWGWGACAADFNNDGMLDIFHTNGYGMWDAELLADVTLSSVSYFINQYLAFNDSPNRFFLGNGDGTFTEMAATLGVDGTNAGLGVICLDADNDGDIDLFVNSNDNRPYFYRNNAAGMADAHFLGVQLSGRYPNSRAIGAKVEITVGGQKQTQWMTLNSNYNSHNAPRLHFGLGAATTVDQIKVYWPGGAVTTQTSVAADAFIAIAQP